MKPHGPRDICYEHNGRRHTMVTDEVDAIERSGRCSWQEYAAGLNTPGYRDVTRETMAAAIRGMRARPGQTEPGTATVHTYDKATGLPMLVRSACKPIHWLIWNSERYRWYKACDQLQTVTASKEGMSGARFRSALSVGRSCAKCVTLYRLRHL